MKLPKKFKKVFVSGGAGFIGSHFVDELVQEGKEVVVFDNLSSGKKEFLKKSISMPNFSLKMGDLLNPEDIAGAMPGDVDLVIHLAANPDISKGVKDPSLDFKQTIVATFNLLQVMKDKKIKHLIYFSGSGVYGDVGSVATNEKFGPLTPVSMYGGSKLSAEGLISAFSNLFGIQAWIFRPANIIGDRATHGVILDFVTRLNKDSSQLLILGDGKQSKSYVHVTDILKGVYLAVSKAHDRINIFNISSKTFITVNDIAKEVIGVMRLTKVKIEHTKGKIGWPGDVPIVRIDSGKLRKLGWKEGYSSREAVRKTAMDLLASK